MLNTGGGCLFITLQYNNNNNLQVYLQRKKLI